MCMSILLPCMYIYHVHAGCPQGPDEGIRSPVTGVTKG